MSDDERWRCCECRAVFGPSTGSPQELEMFCSRACYDAYFGSLGCGPARATVQGQ